MDTFKKAQGLPINTIILIAIGLLILVLFITFVLGGFGTLGSGTGGGSQALAAFQTQCQTYCTDAQQTLSTPTQWCSATDRISNTLYNCANTTSIGVSCKIGSKTYGPTTGTNGLPKNC
ncbi:MAG: hypothetical protein M1348_02410 [Candidatus Parvarchaeota archaeon]|jgi:hypothetical protein|nr:hypothetical protein [Candidatus Parvarchaeota archaeon]